ncbi:hypothetical protein ONZ45_g1010 [Pleurotus djamor]|nr:hypothetical protein ONZ45_g1010 [Pleurotus djamor]
MPKWRRSSSPEEAWGDADGANENGEWPVYIVGEEVDEDQQIRYEARWPTWKREDDTNTTWSRSRDLPRKVLTEWRTAQKPIEDDVYERCQAKESYSINMFTHSECHLNKTYLRSQSYDAKLQLRKRQPLSSVVRRMAHLLQEKQGHPGVNTRTLGQRSTRSSTASSSLRSGSGRRSQGARAPPPQPPPTQRYVQKPSKRKQLSDLWSAAAEDAGAAPVTIVNDDNEIPPLDPLFKYVESTYICHTDVYRPTDPGVLLACSHGRCDPRNASNCDCQDASTMRSGGNPTFAYTAKQTFKLKVPLAATVIECNSRCECPPDCFNRVGQRPRDVPIEVFKTLHCGWGVRSSQDIIEGKVIGIYTGLLMHRRTAEEMPQDLSNYCFDLDNQDSDSEDSDSDSFTVDSRTCGNWSRFIK